VIKLIVYERIYRYTRNDYIVYLFIMDTAASKAKPVSSRKKMSAKIDEAEKITERVEGGIIVRRYKGRKVEP
jgi:hypothetical protein